MHNKPNEVTMSFVQLAKMDHSIFAVFCGILAFAYSEESNLYKQSHLTGKMMGSDATQLLGKPMHYSSVVYFDNQFGWFFGLGVLISEKWVLTDGSLGPQISTLKMIDSKEYLPADLKLTTLIWIGRNHDFTKTRNCLFAQDLVYENQGENYTDGLAIIELGREVVLSNSISLAYLPKEDFLSVLSGNGVGTIILRKDLSLRIENLSIFSMSKTWITLHPRTNDTDRFDVILGGPLFQGHNLLGIASVFPGLSKQSTIHFRSLQNSNDFILHFAACDEDFDAGLHDPGQRLTKKITN